MGMCLGFGKKGGNAAIEDFRLFQPGKMSAFLDDQQTATF
jgi:hypothetical protein